MVVQELEVAQVGRRVVRRAQFGPPGYECNLLYLACLAALVLGGSGPLAIDGLLRKNKRTLKHKARSDLSSS